MEKIKDISITNFKSIKHLEINDCNKINVFIGMPNAGKSNILEALWLYGKSENYHNTIVREGLRYSETNELFFEGNILEKIEININKKISFNIEKDLDNFIKNKEYVNYLGTAKDLICYFTLSTNIIDIDFEFAFGSEFVKNIKKYFYSTKMSSSPEIDGVLVCPYGDNIGQILSSNPKLRNEINEIFKQNNLKLLIEKGTNELKIFKEYQDGTVFTLPYSLIADTLQRLVFYKAVILSNRKSVLLLEEPEAHCFEPYIQEFTNSVKYDENDNQFFIVTHSDFIIQEFLRDEESNKNTNIYLVNNVDGETKVKLLDKEKNDDVYEFGMNAFFNFESLWESN